MLEICILKLDGGMTAQDALKQTIESRGKSTPWLYDVATIARPMIGRVKISATFPDGTSRTLHEGDLAGAVESLGAYTGYYVSSLAGPLTSVFTTANAALESHARGAEAEERLFHLKEIKKALPRESSALVLVGSTEICDQMAQAFQDWDPEVIRRDASEELRKYLESLHRALVQGVTHGVPVETTAAPTPR